MYEKLIKSLRTCSKIDTDCIGCLKEGEIIHKFCWLELMSEAATAIEKLQKENENISQNFEVLRQTNAIQGEKISIYESFVPQWISVEERLPEKAKGRYWSDEVLVWDGESEFIACYGGLQDMWTASTRITHWMPKPVPPKEET